MTRLAVAPGRDRLLRAGDVHVPLLDTLWSAFSEPTPEEWHSYLEFRRAQGFTGVLVSLLPPLHDRSQNPGARLPFPTRADGTLDPSEIRPEYLVHARRQAEAVVAAGLELFLVVLWSNYVPDSPSSTMPPAITLPADVRATLPALVAEHFADLDPVLVISGDDPFTDPTVIALYRDLLHACRAAMPDLLTTFHMWPDAVLPRELLDDPALDLSTLQSGHTADDGAKAIELATRAVGEPRRPILNLEPCYEGHGHVRSTGRFSAAEVRRVLWTSLTAGASAGLGYGAHGVWQWHRPGSVFTNGGFSGQPYPWLTALALPGADDASFARTLWADLGFAGAVPAQQLLDREADGTRLARGDGGLALYLPDARAVDLAVDPTRVRAWDLAARRPVVPRLRPHGDGVRLDPPDTAGDLLVVLEDT